MTEQKKKLNALQTKKLVPVLKQFNAIAKVFLRVLSQKVAREEEHLSKIAVLVTGIAPPEQHHSISIQTIDINKTKVSKKGSFSFNQKMDWEQELRKKKRGMIL